MAGARFSTGPMPFQLSPTNSVKAEFCVGERFHMGRGCKREEGVFYCYAAIAVAQTKSVSYFFLIPFPQQ